MLSLAETFWLRWHVRHDSVAVARRARIVLLADGGIPAPSIAKQLKTNPGTVTRVVNDFHKRRLTAFPTPSLTRAELMKALKVDLAHARFVSAAAVQLFHIMDLPYQLPANLLPTLETAALLHNLGMTVDDARHHLAGRDLLQHVKISDLSRIQQRVIACMVRFHRKSVRPEEEPLFAGLTPAWRQRTLQLAAILRVADGLDYSQTQSTVITNFVASPEAIQVHLAGSQAGVDGSRAKRKSDLSEIRISHSFRAGTDHPAPRS